MSRLRLVIALISLLLLPTALTPAVSVRTWSASSPRELARGQLEGTTLDAEGRIGIAPALAHLWGPGEGIVWDVEPDGTAGAFVAISSPSRVLQVGGEAGERVWYRPSGESLVATLLPDSAGGIYVGVSPEGRVLHAAEPERLTVVAETEAAFIWALAATSDGSVWIGTGLPGMLMRLDEDGELSTVFDSGDDPVRCIAAHPDGGVVFGTGGRGRVIRAGEDGRAFVLFDAEEAEIVALEIADDGTVHALAARGSKQIAAAKSAAADVTVRVTATAPDVDPDGDEDGNGNGDGESEEERDEPQRAPRRFKTPPGGVLYEIAPEGGARKVWQSAGEVPFGLATGADGRLLVSTGDSGRVYVLDEQDRPAILLELPSEQASAMATATDGRVFVGGTTDARVAAIGPGAESSGSYLTPVVDAGTVAEWGRLGWAAKLPSGGELRVAVRAGNTDEPDATWSDWRHLEASGRSEAIADLPSTRWFQARFDLVPSRRGDSPHLGRVEVYYLPHNRAPEISELSVQPPGVVWSLARSQSPRRIGPLVSTDSVSRAAVEAIRPKTAQTPIRKSYEPGARTVTWTAKDPDGDTLSSRIEIRGEGEATWIPLAEELEGGFFSWDVRGLPDGHYRARLTVTDSSDNPAGKQRVARRVSTAFRVDNTRPRVSDPEIGRLDGEYAVEFTAFDPGGIVTAMEVAVDAGEWKPLDPLDGVADSEEERYRMRISRDRAGEDGKRTVRVRVTDSAGNLAGAVWVLGDR